MDLPADRETLIDQLLMLASRGYPVLPLYRVVDGSCNCRRGRHCGCPGKHPRPHKGFAAASTEEKQILKWLRRPNYVAGANWAIRTGRESNLFVVDFDYKERGGRHSYAEAVQIAPEIDDTVIVNTGAGRHVFFRHSGGQMASTVRQRPGVDTRGEGGIVIVPPSQHHTGASYDWVNRIDDFEVQNIPPALIGWLSDPKPSRSILSPSASPSDRAIYRHLAPTHEYTGTLNEHSTSAALREEIEEAVPQGNRETKKTVFSSADMTDLASLVESSVPRIYKASTRNKLVCNLARKLKFSRFAQIDVNQLRKAFVQQHDLIVSRAIESGVPVQAERLQHLREGEAMFANAKVPLSGVAEAANECFAQWCSKDAYPHEVGEAVEYCLAGWDGYDCKLVLLCWCYHQKASGGTWFLTCREAASLLFRHANEEVTHQQVNASMLMLSQLGILSLVERGSHTRRKANVWLWKFAGEESGDGRIEA